MNTKLRYLGAIAILLTCASIPSLSSADITTANAHNDRASFDVCGDAMDKLDDSVAGTRFKATQACSAAMIYYAGKMEAAKSEDDRCVNGLYAGSSTARYGVILKTSMNQAGATKTLALANMVLRGVIANCPDEPNILLGAKGMLDVVKSDENR